MPARIEFLFTPEDFGGSEFGHISPFEPEILNSHPSPDPFFIPNGQLSAELSDEIVRSPGQMRLGENPHGGPNQLVVSRRRMPFVGKSIPAKTRGRR